MAYFEQVYVAKGLHTQGSLYGGPQPNMIKINILSILNLVLKLSLLISLVIYSWTAVQGNYALVKFWVGKRIAAKRSFLLTSPICRGALVRAGRGKPVGSLAYYPGEESVGFLGPRA